MTGSGSPARFLVTGASGFIGFPLVQRLVTTFGAVNVQAVVPPRSRSQLEEARRRRLESLGVSVLVHDLLAGDGLPDSLQPFDVLFHLAAFTESESADSDVRVNDVGTDRFLSALSDRLRGRRVLYTSTLAAVDRRAPSNEPLSEAAPCYPRTPYGKTKLRAETVVKRQAVKLAFEWTVVRLPTVYGPGFRRGGMFNLVAQGLRRRAWVTRLRWPGRMSLVYVDDVVEVLVALVGCRTAANQSYHVSAPNPPRFDELYDDIARTIGVERVPIELPKAFWDLVRRIAWAPGLRHFLPFKLWMMVWRVSLLVVDGLVADGEKLERTVVVRHTRLADGLKVAYGATGAAEPSV